MSFYQDLYQYTKAGCPILCIYSDLSVDTYIDIPIRNNMIIYSMGTGYEWNETGGLRDFDTKESILGVRAETIKECLSFFTAAPPESSRRFLVIKSPLISLTDPNLAKILRSAAKKISSEETRKMIIIICSTKQIPPKKAVKPLRKRRNPHNQDELIKYLELNEAGRYEIQQSLFPLDYPPEGLSECPELSAIIRSFKEKAGFDNTEDKTAYEQSMQETVSTADIYDAICKEHETGMQESTSEQIKYRKGNYTVQLRRRLCYFLEKVLHSDMSLFQNKKGKLVKLPKSEAAIIQMLISASMATKKEDLLIANWVMGKYENPCEVDYDDLLTLYREFESRINKLCSDAKIDHITKDRWMTYFKVKLKYDAIPLTRNLMSEIESLVQSTKPLRLLSNHEYGHKGVLNLEFMAKAAQIQQTIEHNIVPLLVSQEDYLLCMIMILRTLNQSAINQSEVVLEKAYVQLKSEEPQLNTPYYIAYPGITVLGPVCTWAEFLTESLTANQSLKPALCDNPVLKDLISEISARDNAEIEENFQWTDDGKFVKKPKKKEKDPKQE